MAEAAAAEALCREQAALSTIISVVPQDAVVGTGAAAGAASGSTAPPPQGGVVVTADRVGEAIEAVMQERHARETSDLLMSQFKCVVGGGGGRGVGVVWAGLCLLFCWVRRGLALWIRDSIVLTHHLPFFELA